MHEVVYTIQKRQIIIYIIYLNQYTVFLVYLSSENTLKYLKDSVLSKSSLCIFSAGYSSLINIASAIFECRVC